MIPLNETRKRDQIECPTCAIKGCFAHCNHCGIEIKWKDEQGDPRYDTRKDGKRIRVVFENDYSVHRCMQKGTKDGNYYNVKREKVYYKLNDDVGTPDEGRVYGYYPLQPSELSQFKADMRRLDLAQKNYMCKECGRPYNREIYPLCPSCWKMECRKCGNKVPWRANKETHCVECGNETRDPIHVWRATFRLYGKKW